MRAQSSACLLKTVGQKILSLTESREKVNRSSARTGSAQKYRAQFPGARVLPSRPFEFHAFAG